MKRVVIKIGTNALADAAGHIDQGRIDAFADQIMAVRAHGVEVIIVSSGAVSQGLAHASALASMSKRAYAAIGQADLIARYASAFRAHGALIGQILVSHRDFQNKGIYQFLQRTLAELAEAGVVPVVNENDAITNETAASFHDNDSLAVALALMVSAQIVLILSHINGLYTQDPKHPGARLIPSVTDVNRELIKLCEKTTSQRGSGGMIAKVKAARLACAFGISTVIANSAIPGVIEKAIAGATVGTVFSPRQNHPHLRNRSRWIVSAKISSGSLVVDNGASQALAKGKSLLAVGIKKIYGGFKKGEIIEVLNTDGDALAIGIVNTDDQTLRGNIEKGNLYNQEVIHADNLILIQ